jgi:hypothetical protein
VKPLTHLKKHILFTFANGVAGATLIQTASLPYVGELLNIHQVNINATNPVTAKLEIVDEFGFTIFDGTAKAENAAYDHEFGVTTRRILGGGDSLRCTLSGDPGATGYTVDVVLSLFGRDG